jgi:uncharacterized membrane-anchored protein YjiN (DUF445 family)
VANTAETVDSVARRRSLRRHRTVATTLLVVMGVAYFGALRSGLTGFWIDLLRAGAEAALVGGLADWFAVTALFRRPLGLPIPHTAVIPNSKDRIGAGLGRFIERHFLEPELVGSRLRQVGVSARLGAWLAERRNADLVSDRLAVIAGFLFRSLNDQKLQRLVRMTLRRQLSELDPAPALATLLAVLQRNGAHHQLLDQVLKVVRTTIAGNQDRILEIVAERSRWWVPRQVDRKLAEEITLGLLTYISDLESRDYEARAGFDAAIARLIDDLRRPSRATEKVGALRDRFLAAPEVNAYFAELWQALRARLEQELAQPDSRLREALSGALRALGTAIAEDPEVQARMDRRIEEAVQTLIVPWRADIGQFVADVVKSWETRTIVDRVELAVGKDLQYIRLNGTLVGAAVGCAIFALTTLLR